MRRLLLLIALLAGCSQAFGQTMASGVTQVGRFIWLSDDPAFGGMSGIEISDDGSRFIALSDRSTLWEGTVTRKGGVITALTPELITPLHISDGSPTKGHHADGRLAGARGVHNAGAGKVGAKFWRVLGHPPF